MAGLVESGGCCEPVSKEISPVGGKYSGSFLRGTGNSASLINNAGSPNITVPQVTFDIILRNGEVVDGTGAPRRRADVAVTGDRISGISEGA